MTEHEKIFFSILRSALWKTPIEIPKGFTGWEKVFKLTMLQSQIGLVGEIMLMNPQICEQLSEIAQKRILKLVHSTSYLHMKLSKAIAFLVMKLRANGIEPILLKGHGLAKCYPIPELRQSGDIDLYVGVDQYEKTYDVLKEFVTHIDDKSKIWGWMHFDAKLGDAMIEVHRTADYMYSKKEDALYRKYMLDGLSKELRVLMFDNIEVNTPNDNFNAFYIFYHLWRHFTGSGVGLRQFCDWACFLHNYSKTLDISYLEEILKTFDLLKPWQVFGCFLVADLGLPANEFPLYNPKYSKNVHLVRRYVLTDGNFGVNLNFSQHNASGYISRKFISFKRHILRVIRLFVIFPKHSMKRLLSVFSVGVGQVLDDARKTRVSKK